MKRAHVFAVVLVALLPISSASPADTSIRAIRTTSLPDGVRARDVRWAGPNEVYIGTGKGGVLKTSIDSPETVDAVMPSAEHGGFAVSGRIGVGQTTLLVGSPFGAMGWIPLEGSSRNVRERGLLTLMDLDARGDRAVVLGADSGPLQGLARDGTIAWIGSFSESLSDMRPLMKGRSTPGGRDMARCSILETGAIRFMKDGSIVIVPGVEPGIYRYSSGGKLLQTWDSAALGIVDDCSIPDEDLLVLARDFPRRIEWFASRITLDELLPWRDGPALVLRRVEDGVTRWDLVTLPYRGVSRRYTLPVTIPSPRGHVRGDVRGDRMVLLAFDDALPGGKPIAPPRLIVLSIDEP